MKKDSQLLIRVSDLEKQGFERVAELNGISLSAWARQVLRREAIRYLQDAGEKIIFLEPIHLKPIDNGR